MKKFFIILIIILFISFVTIFYQQNIKIFGYKKHEIMKVSELLYDKDPNHWEKIYINNKGDVAYKNKVIFTDSGKPLNGINAYTTTEFEIFFKADGAVPKDECDPTDYKTNGRLGCYIYGDES